MRPPAVIRLTSRSCRRSAMVTLTGGQIVESPMSELVVATKTLDLIYYDEAAAFFY